MNTDFQLFIGNPNRYSVFTFWLSVFERYDFRLAKGRRAQSRLAIKMLFCAQLEAIRFDGRRNKQQTFSGAGHWFHCVVKTNLLDLISNSLRLPGDMPNVKGGQNDYKTSVKNREKKFLESWNVRKEVVVWKSFCFFFR